MNRASLFFLFVLFLTVSAQAQDMIEVFRGDEIDDRNFRYNESYFLNILSFDHDMALEREWDFVPSGYRGTAGSLHSKGIYLDQDLKLGSAVDERLSFRVHFRQAEDFDSRYERFVFEPEYKLNENWSLTVPLQVMSEKDDLDLGISAIYRAPSIHYLKWSYVGQNALFNSETEGTRKFQRNPGTFAFQGSVEPAPGAWLKWTIGDTLPLKWEVDDRQFDFEFRRFYYRVLNQIALDTDSDLYFSVWGEQAGKSRNFVSGFDSQDSRLNRSVIRFRAEFRERFCCIQARAGVQYFAARENEHLLNNPAESQFLRRREYSAFLGWSTQYNEKARIGATFFLSDLHNFEKLSSSLQTRDDDPISKLELSFEYDFSPKAHLAIEPSIQFFGSTPYGGTNVQLVVTF